MKILDTGGAGFIGSAVIRHVVKNTSDSVVNVEKLTYAGNLDWCRRVQGGTSRKRLLKYTTPPAGRSVPA